MTTNRMTSTALIMTLAKMPASSMTDAQCDEISDAIIDIAEFSLNEFRAIIRILDKNNADHSAHILDTFRDNTPFSSLDLP